VAGLPDLQGFYHDSDAVENSILWTGSQAHKKSASLLFQGLNFIDSRIKKFPVPQNQNMVRADVFLRVLYLVMRAARESRANSFKDLSPFANSSKLN